MRTWMAMSGWSVGDVDKEDERSTTPKNPRSKWLQDPMVKGRRGDRLAKMAEGWGRYGARSGLWETQIHISKEDFWTRDRCLDFLRKT